MFIRWKVKGWYDYAYLEKRVRDNGKVTTKLVVYLGKHPSSKLEAMLRLGQITALSGDENIIKKALKNLDYHLRRNYCAYKSHSKKLAGCLSG